ncbi:uracil-DNA glycosylase [Streptomyces sp. NBC_00083]|uniref:uracil-DNA glycosylase n=1 Tax=Streptomyces sp. NBC_00083 TaxID=2975647 RepID=UPI00224D2FF3|nr:uracil-DNA glycosylase [Streptomyces sp. NBC_00083]MCX5384156.1 uracil-DNA glycosylase [Streptomyces sp. NBC_00083]
MDEAGSTGTQPTAADRGFPAYHAARSGGLGDLDRRLVGCRACPRLVAWREEVAETKRAGFQGWEYWGRPVPGFGPHDAPLAVVGLAPAAHGANRTGRMFTGDASGDFLFAALHAVGLASQPTATTADDGLALNGVRVTSPVHCAPPANKPTPEERDTCRPWLAAEIAFLNPRAIVVLGAFGWQTLLPVLADAGWQLPRPRPRFAHGNVVTLRRAEPDAPRGGTAGRSEPGPGPAAHDELHVIGCYHPSQRNTFTGRLTSPMLRDLLRRAAGLAGLGGPSQAHGARPDPPRP